MSNKRFFCIRGHMKSGTNWICRLLNLHPEIDCQGEYHWHRYFEAYTHNRDILNNLKRSEAEKPLIRRNLSQFVRSSMIQRADPDALLLGDRTPYTICPVVVPNAPHISLIRDCRDVLVSKMFHFFNGNSPHFFNRSKLLKSLLTSFQEDPWYFQKFPEKLLINERFVRETCQNWAQYIRSDQRTAIRQPQLPVMFVQYEQVHVDVRGVLDRMYQFLEVDPALVKTIPPNLMPGHKTETPNKFNRKGEVGDWRNYITERVKTWINEEAGAVMLEQGYIQSLDWEIGQPHQKKSAA